ncbi:MAG: iron-containing alcohol dehydrogenase [Oscillospiraceae bacterium]|nr:iron-containing alcohol dehydrogenase [Oscillospiraceae bacterium]
MLNFDFHAPTRLVFGKDCYKQIGPLLADYQPKKILLHYGGGSIKRSGVYDAVTASLREAGLDFIELGGVVPNPRVTLAREGVTLCRDQGVDLILAVGGGSAIDSAKAIAMGVYYDGDVWDIYEKNLMGNKALPVATILTIPAAGSECSPSTVISNDDQQRKLGHTEQCVRPLISCVDPSLFATLPPNQIANGVADMMSHIFERYFTGTDHCALTDGLCESVLRTIIQYAPKVYADPGDYDSWCQIGLAGTLAHNDLLGLGRDEDWACHQMEHELSAIYDVAHGAGLAVLTPAWMTYIYREHLPMFLQFAVKVMGIDGSYREPEAVIEEAIDKLRAFYRLIGLPQTLEELGIGNDNYEIMAKKATRIAYGPEKQLGGIQKLGWQDVLAVYGLCG